MKKVFKLEGLDCANCAAKMEDKIGKLEGVKEVSVNFMSSKMTIVMDGDKEKEILSKAEKVIHKLEPDVDIKAI